MFVRLLKKEMIDLYYKMLLIRRFEEKAAEMYTLGKIGGFCHLYIGQEAVAVGAISPLREDDYVISSYREHGHCLAKGSDPKRVMAELFAKETGICKGLGGSMHLFDAGKNFLGGHAIVGGQIALATGVGFAIKYEERDQVIVCFFGEGAVNSGYFHESLNLAALWKLPVIYICENNRYGMGTPIERASALYNVAQKAYGYDMANASVDGMDVLAVRESVEEAIDLARHQSEPTLIEARTYRFMGHSMADPAHSHYRTREELDEHKKQDPIFIFRERLIEEHRTTEEELKEIDREIKELMIEVVDFADQSSELPPDRLFEFVYA
ncbi:MAG: pyruvate dehydrogenase (acetyl-transferring) E1 component subunit alpha [Candidatus Tectomicrobia bacterium]|nr:pyruvate dehydrogenase (acetyl-transferring) E1 component subunit alpha [Candidatus Tectomicrobia bacterium]